jgi:3-hydroxybutyryl-CoA dehydrogenase
MSFDNKDNLTMGIIGAGAMGRGIAQVAALSGMNVLLYDNEANVIVSAISFIEDMINKSAAKGKITEADAKKAVALIKRADHLKDFSRCDVVIEAIIEDLNAKRELFKKLEDIVSNECIIATNTSSLSVTAIAAVCRNPKRIAGFHFFNPVPLMKLVEVVRGLATEVRTINSLVGIAQKMGHTPVVTKDAPGFIVNHAGRAYVTESLAILSENIADTYQIDAVLRDAAGFRMGPFELFDLTGLDISHTATEAIYNQFYQDPRFRPSYIAQTRLNAGLLGRKTGRGFYAYENGNQVLQEKNGKKENIDIKGIKVWVDTANTEGFKILTAYLKSKGIAIDTGNKPDKDSLIVVSPVAEDATTTALNTGLDPKRVIAVDTLMGFDKHRTMMSTPATLQHIKDTAETIFSADGVAVDSINDSPGFIAGRVLAMVVNIGCNVAEKGIAAPEDIDRAVKLGLGYPFGPLEWGDKIGAGKVLDILNFLYNFYGDPRYRPTPWLRRRARLGIPLTRKVQ